MWWAAHSRHRDASQSSSMKAASFFSLNFASIGFKKRHSIVEKIDFVDDKIFFGIEKIGFVTEMI